MVKSISLVRRLMLILLLASVTISLGMVAIMQHIFQQQIQTTLANKSQVTLDYLAGSLAVPIWNLSDDVVRQIARTAAQDEIIGMIEVTDFSRKKLVYEQRKEADEHLIQASRVIEHEGFRVGEVRIGLSAQHFDKQLATWITFLLAAASVIIVLSTLLMAALLRRFLRIPFAELTAIVNAYGKGNYASDVVVRYSEFQPFSNVLREMGSDLLKQVTAQIPGMVFQYRLRPDGSACFPYASAGIRELLLVDPYEVRDDASRAFAHVHPDDLPALQDSIQKSALTGRPWHQRFRIRRGNAPVHWLQGNAVPLREADGGCLWNGFMTDVTAEVEIDTQLRLLASVFGNSQEGITITDADGHIVDVNPAFTRITGYRRDEVLGRSPRMHSSGQQDAAFYARMWAALGETGAWRGEIWNRNKAGEVYPVLLSIAAVKDDAGRITHYIGSYSDIKELKSREAQLDQLAHFDALTGLPNRRLLNDRLQQAMAHARRSSKIMAVGVVDLDNFKPINDTFGHAAGDAVLVEIAQRLSKCLRENDTVARTGGDEFVLLLDGLERAEECDVVLTRLLHDVTQPIRFGENESEVASVSASIGLTLFPQDGADAEVLMRHADQAMYQAKEAGRNCYQLFNVAHD